MDGALARFGVLDFHFFYISSWNLPDSDWSGRFVCACSERQASRRERERGECVSIRQTLNNLNVLHKATGSSILISVCFEREK